MNIVFFGSSAFSVPILEALLKAHSVKWVVTTPDRKKGRGQKTTPNEIKSFCLERGVDCLDPETLKDPKLTELLRSKSPDFLVVASYGKMIPESIFSMPRSASLNVHPSLLPKYRGASPIQSALLAGESQTGVSIAEVTKDLDAGDLFAQAETSVGVNENAFDLSRRLSDLGARLVLDVIAGFETKTVQKTPQNPSRASYAGKFEKSFGGIDWNKTAQEIHRLVRACYPWPSAFASFRKKRIKILGTELAQGSSDSKGPGIIAGIDRNQNILWVGTHSGNIGIKKVQLEGRKEVSALDFVRGERVAEGERFESIQA